MEPTNEVISGRSDTVDLEAVNRSLSTAVSELMAELSKADAEVERLLAALKEIRDAGPMTLDDQRWRIALAALEGK